jgi:hypothetical protein
MGGHEAGGGRVVPPLGVGLVVGDRVDVRPPGGGEDEDRREPTTTLSGWRQFVDSAPASFDLLPDEQWQSLTGRDRGYV